MIMCLLAVVLASLDIAILGWGILFETRSHDAVQFLVLPSMCNYLVCVRAIVITFQTMEMTA